MFHCHDKNIANRLRNYKYINNLKIYNKSNAVTFVER